MLSTVIIKNRLCLPGHPPDAVNDLRSAEEPVEENGGDDYVGDLLRHLPARHLDLLSELEQLVAQVQTCAR